MADLKVQDSKKLDSNKKEAGKITKPFKYKTPEDLLEAVNRYFAENEFEKYSVTGLALVIGSKQLLNDYEDRENYSWIVKQAKLLIENSYELSLRDKGRTGDIFALKNFGWKDKTETEHSGEINTFTLKLGE